MLDFMFNDIEFSIDEQMISRNKEALANGSSFWLHSTANNHTVIETFDASLVTLYRRKNIKMLPSEVAAVFGQPLLYGFVIDIRL